MWSLVLPLLVLVPEGWGAGARHHHYANHHHHNRNHSNNRADLWRRDYAHARRRKHEIEGQNPNKAKIKTDDPELNITRIYDRINKFHKRPVLTVNSTKRSAQPPGYSPGLWQFDTAGNDDVKLLVSDVSKTAANIVKTLSRDDTTLVGEDLSKSKASIATGERRGCITDCGITGMPGLIPGGQRGGRFSQFSNELFMPVRMYCYILYLHYPHIGERVRVPTVEIGIVIIIQK